MSLILTIISFNRSHSVQSIPNCSMKPNSTRSFREEVNYSFITHFSPNFKLSILHFYYLTFFILNLFLVKIIYQIQNLLFYKLIHPIIIMESCWWVMFLNSGNSKCALVRSWRRLQCDGHRSTWPFSWRFV